ncbi:DedA family protein [Chitinibacter bivalviorum]|uniref:DedA family protein n=1 Tax=Chitinibacter bivalviorum TaxID=2739434 RepID=A0A7H9BKD4_9NEIS|nr:DedA family protein [Chitinibacter bivalviorum]QLG88949.1 DedA family protein [Chitinibacter bivalviorum]
METWLHSLLAHSSELALLLLFIIVLAESTAIVGLLIPGTVLMLAMGALIGNGQMDFWVACAVGFIAALIGDGLSYWLGYRYRSQLHRLSIIRPHRRLLIQARLVLRHHGPVGIFVGRFLGPTRPVLPMVAGMLSMPRRRFWPACVLACLLWTPAYLMPGILAGAAIGLASDGLFSFPILLTLAAISVGLVLWLGTQAVRHSLRARALAGMPVHLSWGAPLSGIACAVAVWQIAVHPLAPIYGARVWQVLA